MELYDDSDMYVEGDEEIVKLINKFIEYRSEETTLALYQGLNDFCRRVYGTLCRKYKISNSFDLIDEMISQCFVIILERLDKGELSKLTSLNLYFALKDFVVKRWLPLSKLVLKDPNIPEKSGEHNTKASDLDLVEHLVGCDRLTRLRLVTTLYSNMGDVNQETVDFINSLTISQATVEKDSMLVLKVVHVLSELQERYGGGCKLLLMMLGMRNFTQLIILNSLLKLKLRLPTLVEYAELIDEFYTNLTLTPKVAKNKLRLRSDVGSVQDFILKGYTDRLYGSLDILIDKLSRQEVNIQDVKELTVMIRILQESAINLASG